MIGAIDFVAAAMGRLPGYRVTVYDAHPAFATAHRRPGTDEVITR